MSVALRIRGRRRPAPKFGTLNASTAQVANYITNHLEMAGLQTGWDRHCKSAGTWSTGDLDGYAADFAGFKSAGLRLSLEMGYNYPPSFYQNSTYVFKDQFGNYSSGRALDWVWRSASRDLLEGYVRKLDEYVPFSDATISDVRISTDEISELLFPQHTQGGTTGSYWGYSTPAQGGAGLATGTVGGVARHAVACPTAWIGWKPGDALPSGKSSPSEWYQWYLGSLAEASAWMVALLRSLDYTGRVWATVPGKGAVPSVVASSYTNLLAQYEDVMAVGAAWHLVYPLLAASGSGIGGWCSSTAEDASTDITQPGDASGAEDEAWSSMRIHAYLAAVNGMARAVENPGTGTNNYGLTMLQEFVKQAVACRATVAHWAFDADLANGTGGSYGGAVSWAGYKAAIEAFGHLP
jgi:hypothetical protein